MGAKDIDKFGVNIMEKIVKTNYFSLFSYNENRRKLEYVWAIFGKQKGRVNIFVTLQAILMPLPKRHLTRLERHITSYVMYKSRVKSLVNIFCLWGDTITPTSDLAFPHCKAIVA